MTKTEQRREMLDLMERVHGIDYTFGWLRQAFCVPIDEEIADAVVHSTHNQLLLELVKLEKPNV